MAQIELIMPKMGESIMEATILKWVKNVGDRVEMDETILEIATDKVDSEVPSPVSGVISQILFAENTTVEIGKVIAVIATEGESAAVAPTPGKQDTPSSNGASAPKEVQVQAPIAANAEVPSSNQPKTSSGNSNKFFSPLVRNIAKQENVSLAELETLDGSGLNGRITKKDILSFVDHKKTSPVTQTAPKVAGPVAETPASSSKPAVSFSGKTEIVEMDRMRKLIADHMVMSKQTSPHVTSFVEADVTNLVNWRNKIKKEFHSKYGENITYTPIFIEAIARAIRDFPMINVSVDGTKIIVKKDINIGMAAALPSGNLIVPVIKNADLLNLAGLTKSVNDLANRARNNQLKPDEIQNGTFTVTNVGTFGNLMGTPIINQPQVAIIATGAILKKPAVLETEYGDVIAIRQMMFLSMSYDHRVVDGFLGGSFLRKVADYLEGFDPSRDV